MVVDLPLEESSVKSTFGKIQRYNYLVRCYLHFEMSFKQRATLSNCGKPLKPKLLSGCSNTIMAENGTQV